MSERRGFVAARDVELFGMKVYSATKPSSTMAIVAKLASMIDAGSLSGARRDLWHLIFGTGARTSVVFSSDRGNNFAESLLTMRPFRQVASIVQ